MELINQSLEALSQAQEGTILVIHQEKDKADFSTSEYTKIQSLFIWQGNHKLNVLALNLEHFFFGTLIEWEEVLNSDITWNKFAQKMNAVEFVPDYMAFEFLDTVADLMSVGELTQYPQDNTHQQEHNYIEAIDQWQSGIDMDLLPDGTMLSDTEEAENYVSVTVKIK